MSLLIWTYDLAREQCPTYEHLKKLAEVSLDAGYDALGLYFEHRLQMDSAPWAAGVGAMPKDWVRQLRKDFPNLRVIPFMNLLGHFEGFLYTQEGRKYREEALTGLQANPAHPEFPRFCLQLIDEIFEIFDDEMIHLGGDETAQLGQSSTSKQKMDQWLMQLDPEEQSTADAKAMLYGEHFKQMCEYVLQKGRTPALWGDMFAAHPTALNYVPKETYIFDWQYFNGVAQTSRQFVDAGYRVIGCPCIQTYNAVWCHLKESESNIREIASDVREMNLAGMCVTTWECALYGAYDTLFPALKGAAQIFRGSEQSLLDAYEAESEAHGEWARLMSDDLAGVGWSFSPTRIRSSLKVRLLLQANPFLAWVHHREEIVDHGLAEKVLGISERALRIAPTDAEAGVCLFLRAAVEFVLIAESADRHYSAGQVEGAISRLAMTRQLFDDLAKIGRRSHERIGGSLADMERCRVAKEHVERCIHRMRQYGDGALGYRPSLEVITHPRFVQHDQGCWWLINKWANQ